MFFETNVLKNFPTFTKGLKACNFFKKKIQYTCFPVNIAKFFNTAFL